MTARQYDLNGWFEVPRNPLSRVGVFPYLGSSIGAPEPDKIYQVYRPAEELGHPDTLASFRLTPFVDDHEMLGAEEDGLTPAEKKGVHGVIGEKLEFDGSVLYGNLKVFSEELARKLAAGKKEVSCGYRCVYEFTPGVYEGKPYDAIQRTLRGNHTALVNEGRMGPEFAVLDHMKFTLDAKDMTRMDPELMGKVATALEAALAAVKEAMGGAAPAADPAAPAAVPGGDETTPAADMGGESMAGDEGSDTMAGDEGADAIPGAEGADAMTQNLSKRLAAVEAENKRLRSRPTVDAADVLREAAARDKLADRLKPHIGTFDHAPMTLAQVAAYGVQKVGLKNVPKGSEVVALDAYLTGKPDPNVVVASHGTDAAPKASFVTRHLEGPAAP